MSLPSDESISFLSCLQYFSFSLHEYYSEIETDSILDVSEMLALAALCQALVAKLSWCYKHRVRILHGRNRCQVTCASEAC